MEFVEGPSCADLIREEKELGLEQAVRYVVDACHGLDYAHRAGVIHRDVKPGNLLVSTESGALKLADFGIAKAAEQTRITQVGSVLGTAAYLSPEQARGEEAGPASDVYSLGVCAYQFLAGRLPHEYGSITELALKQQNDEVESIRTTRPEVPARARPRDPGGAARRPRARATRPRSRWRESISAGARGEDTEATMRLAAAPTRLTSRRRRRSPGPNTSRATRRWWRRSRCASAHREPAPRRRAERRPAKRRSRAGRFLLALLLLAAGAVAAVAAVSAMDNGGIDAPNETDVQNQVQELKDLVRQYAE